MTSQHKSSRKRMDGRIKSFVKSNPAVFYKLDPKTQEERPCANRARRVGIPTMQRKAANKDFVQAANDKRKKNQVSARRELRKIRNETKRAMRRAAGL